ncbi:uncharacterized protein LOC120698814 isoform X3 [Panicum virgatum]|uniref:uncharacterized protein LOC120698814 isoform X3 n=1 Tax=Panicum virgatum TaxID=38727 RepID=UPI0019D610D6|nr:uncharacterized protein LOC120698814 isoform X3 [Panicum virgatum]
MRKKRRPAAAGWAPPAAWCGPWGLCRHALVRRFRPWRATPWRAAACVQGWPPRVRSFVGGYGEGWLQGHCKHRHFICGHRADERETQGDSTANIWMLGTWLSLAMNHLIVSLIKSVEHFSLGTLDAMMCTDDAPDGASKMLAEVARLLRPHGIYLLITYGAPKERLQLVRQAGCSWSIALYIMPTPRYQSKMSKGAPQSTMEEVALTEDGQLPPDYVLKDPESNFIYICHKLAVKEAN